MGADRAAGAGDRNDDLARALGAMQRASRSMSAWLLRLLDVVAQVAPHGVFRYPERLAELLGEHLPVARQRVEDRFLSLRGQHGVCTKYLDIARNCTIP